MANRDLNNFRQVTQVEAKQPSNVAAAIADYGTKAIDANQKAKVAENLSSAQYELNDLDNQYRIKNESNPFDAKALQNYKKDRQSLFTKYDSDISSFYSGDWSNATLQLSDQSDTSMQNWGYKQSAKNAVTSFNKTIDNTLKQVGVAGRDFALSDDMDITPYLNLEQNKANLMEIGTEFLGEETTKTALEPMDTDALKVFISNVAEVNPQKATALLDEEQIKSSFTVEERTEFAAVINKNQKLKDIQKQALQVDNSDKVFALVNADTDYYEKRLAIDTMEFNEEITPKMATEARRVLTSTKNLDATTSTPVMSDLITRMYDLNAIQETDSKGYLQGVQNMKEEIMTRQSAGELSNVDATSLNNRLTTLTSAKMSDATQRVGLDFTQANDQFEALPPEFRGKATRELFYTTDGNEDVSQETINKQATNIVNQINFERRTNALKQMDEVTGAKAREFSPPPEIEMVNTPKLQESAIMTISSPSDKAFLDLPSGTQFLDNNGVLRTKK